MTMSSIRNRVQALRMVPAADLLDHGGNWRIHPQAQRDALRGILEQVGIAGALLAYHSARNDGQLTLIDGHARKHDFATEWPTLILDVDDVGADLLLASYDPIAAMAEADRGKLEALLGQITADDTAVQSMLRELAESTGIVPPDIDFKAFDEQVEREVVWHECPACGHRWPK